MGNVIRLDEYRKKILGTSQSPLTWKVKSKEDFDLYLKSGLDYIRVMSSPEDLVRQFPGMQYWAKQLELWLEQEDTIV